MEGKDEIVRAALCDHAEQLSRYQRPAGGLTEFGDGNFQISFYEPVPLSFAVFEWTLQMLASRKPCSEPPRGMWMRFEGSWAE